jgi:biopolymer transport protein ExbB
MTEQARIVRFTAPVLVGEEETEPLEVVRAGPFAAMADGEYLAWSKAEQRLRRLERQPPARYVSTVEDFLDAEGPGFRRLAVDPSRGVLLEALTDTPNLWERIQQGGSVGYTAIALGLAALAIGLFRLADLWWTGRRVDEQLRSGRAATDNPLGRLRAVYLANRDLDPESLELKLDDAILRESGGIQRLLWIVQTVSIVAPLLGLLGTVTGMIQTFQAITLFGAGDPKVMAKGISEALVTTTLGLVIAIPLVLLYALLASRSRGLIETLEENNAAMVAERLERGVEA